MRRIQKIPSALMPIQATTLLLQVRSQRKENHEVSTARNRQSLPEDEQGMDGQLKKEKNFAWQEMLRREAEKLKKMKKQRGGVLVKTEANEEEEDDAVAGLEDFGFSLVKKKNVNDEDEDANADDLDEEDLKHVVDNISDNEGDEEAGKKARKEMEKRDEKGSTFKTLSDRKDRPLHYHKNHMRILSKIKISNTIIIFKTLIKLVERFGVVAS